MISNLEQPMQGESIWTACNLIDGMGFGSRDLIDFATCPKDRVSYYIVYLNHTNNLNHKSPKRKKNLQLFSYTILLHELA